MWSILYTTDTIYSMNLKNENLLIIGARGSIYLRNWES